MKIIKTLSLTVLFAALSLTSLCAQDINEAIELYNSGIKAYQESQYPKAISDIEKALSIVSAVEDEQAPAVKENCEKLIPQLYLSQAKQQVVAKQYADALKSLDNTAAVAGKYNDEEVKASVEELKPQVYTAMGAADVDAGKIKEGIASYKKAMEYDKDNSTLYLRMALAQLKDKDEEGAIASFTQITTMEGAKPNDLANAKKQTSIIYLKRAAAAQPAKKWAVVYENAQKAAGFDDTNMQTQRLLGTAASELKKWDEAIDAYEAVMAADPNAKDKSTSIYRLAMANEAKGDKAKACAYYKQITGDASYKAFAEHKVKELCQ